MITAAAIRAARPSEKAYKLSDEKGLALLVKPSGARLWRFRYVHGGREKMLSLGAFPDTSLALAREKRDAARQLLARGVDPSADRRAKRLAQGDRFVDIAEPWWTAHSKTLSESTRVRDGRVYRALIDRINGKPLSSISTPDFVGILREIRDIHGHEYANRARSLAERIWASAVAVGKLESNPALGIKLSAAVGRAVSIKLPGIVDPKRFAELLRAIDGYQGSPVTRAALKLQARLFVRPQTELLKARWSEVDLAAALWTVPAERVKKRHRHLVPLSWQVALELSQLYELTHQGPDSYVFGSHIPGRPLSENTLNSALRRMDFDTATEHCAHGFRTSASTMLRERVKGQPDDAIEAQLAHAKPGSRQGYDESAYLDERVMMMQRWSDYLDKLTDKGG